MFALGIVSRSFYVAAQGLSTLRTSWPNASQDGYFMCYIVRDDKVHSQMLSNGILRIKSPPNMYPAAGSVWSTMKWYKYALEHTVSKLIGHAEDDVSLNVEVLMQIGMNGVRMLIDHPNLAIGAPEIFHWDLEQHTSHFYWSHFDTRKTWNCTKIPRQNAYKGSGEWHDEHERGKIIGPFVMLKGPLYFLSRRAAQRIMSSTFLQPEASFIYDIHKGPTCDDVFFTGVGLTLASLENITFLGTRRFYSEGCKQKAPLPIHHKPCVRGFTSDTKSPVRLKTACDMRIVGYGCNLAPIRSCDLFNAQNQAG